MTELVLSLFPGIGLLDRAFAAAGFCMVQAPDKITGGDVREFHGVPGLINGIVAGPPCQGFSVINSHRLNPDHHSVRNSREMLQHTCRIIVECEPEWFLIENVPCVPDVRIAGYTVQRIPISHFECGGNQLRSRHIQFGSIHGDIIRPIRVNDCTRNRKKGRPAKAVTTKTEEWKDYADVCRRQDLEQPIRLKGWTRSAKVMAVANGVPLRIGRRGPCWAPRIGLSLRLWSTGHRKAAHGDGQLSEAKAAQFNSKTMGRRGWVSRVVRPVLRSDVWP